MSVVLGIDQSLRHTGVFWLGPGVMGWKQIDTGSRRGAGRLVFIKDAVLQVVLEQNPVLVAMEGYSYGSIGKVFELGELGGVLRVAFEEKNLQTVVVAPSQLKKFITGNAHAEKTDVVAAVNNRLHLKWTDKDNNLADAAALAVIARAFVETSPSTLRHEAEVIAALRGLPKKAPKPRPVRKHKFPKI